MNINSYRYIWIGSRSFDVSNNLRLFESFASWEPYKIRRERKFCNRESFANFWRLEYLFPAEGTSRCRREL